MVDAQAPLDVPGDELHGGPRPNSSCARHDFARMTRQARRHGTIRLAASRALHGPGRPRLRHGRASRMAIALRREGRARNLRALRSPGGRPQRSDRGRGQRLRQVRSEALALRRQDLGTPVPTPLASLLVPGQEPRAAAPDGGLAGSGLIIVNPPWPLENELPVLVPALCEALAQTGDAGSKVEWLAGERY